MASTENRINSEAQTLEESQLITIGFVPLLDSSPLIVADRLGYFQEAGLNVVLKKENSWASILEKVILGVYQGAHMLVPMLVAEALHQEQPRLVSKINLGLNGNAITLTEDLANQFQKDPELFKQRVMAAKEKGAPMTFGVVYPFSMHNYQMRLWLNQQGIDSSEDVQIKVVPPAQMWQSLMNGDIQGFCAGEPWNSYAANMGGGKLVVPCHELMENSVEKALGMNKSWSDNNPAEHQALANAITKACQWLDKDRDVELLAEWMADAQYLGLPHSILKDALESSVGNKIYWSQGATEHSQSKLLPVVECLKKWQPSWVHYDSTYLQNVFID